MKSLCALVLSVLLSLAAASAQSPKTAKNVEMGGPGVLRLKPGDEIEFGHWVEAQPARNSGRVHWKFDLLYRDKNGCPFVEVFLVVGKRQVRVGHRVEDLPWVLDKGMFAPHGVPKRAITACYGWFAGAGDIFYVVRSGRRLKVYRRGIGEGDDGETPSLLVKSIKS